MIKNCDLDKKLFFHEDDYRLIELIPNKNYFFSKKYLEATNRANLLGNNEFGFESIQVISEQPIKLIDEKILVSDVEKILDSFSKNTSNEIEKGYSKTYAKLENAKAWGLEYMVIFMEYSKKYVDSIWLLETGGFLIIEDDRGQKLMNTLLELGNQFELILIDWRKDIIVDISNLNQINNYLKEELKYNL